VTTRSVRHARVVLLDIEGTTTPIAFVHEILFPYARHHAADWLSDPRNAPEAGSITRELAAEYAEDLARGESLSAWPASGGAGPVAAYVHWLMDRDRKSHGLKRLQGLIWEQGYQAGVLRGQVYRDVPAALARWRAAGARTAIYSSGSELAQRRLFESTAHGDLTPYIAGFFDTGVGAKREMHSYARIAGALGEPPRQVLFISDATPELAAAKAAGCQTLLSVRRGNPPQPDAAAYEAIDTLDEVDVVPK
jgi:enolase-phosphatase E1